VKWFFNELSLTGHYSDTEAFCRDLEKLMALRASSPYLRSQLYCSRMLAGLPVAGSINFRQAVQRRGNRDFVVQVLSWLGGNGPFWEDDRQPHAEDLFYFDEVDVTDMGLGEAARRRLAADEAGTFGFPGSTHPCDHDELLVEHGVPEQHYPAIPVPNRVDFHRLQEAAVAAIPQPQTWYDMLTRAGLYENLALAPNILDILTPYPFSAYVAERVIELLGILNRYAASRSADGTNTDETNRLVATYFSGERARFTDESTTNKNDFRAALTFSDPLAPESQIFCPWHGKINTPPFRLHFAWPLLANERKIRVVYIGPKITKA
jgi:hypothetical protein